MALPRADVRIKERGFFYYFTGPHERPAGSTDTNGFISVRGVRSSDVIHFSVPGYRGAAAGFVGSGKVGFGPMPPLNVDTMYLEQKVVDSAGIINIPLIPGASTQ
jgi:hypothetical protein